MPSQQQTSNTPMPVRDSWQTPDWLFHWINTRYRIAVDAAASKSNAKTRCFIEEAEDSLSVCWKNYISHMKPLLEGKHTLFINPPYSCTGKWLEKAWHEAQKGVSIVCLVPAPNGESYWGNSVFGKASEIIFINGRVAFELQDANGNPRPQSGNTRGSCLVIFNRTYSGPTSMNWADRDLMKVEYELHLKTQEQAA